MGGRRSNPARRLWRFESLKKTLEMVTSESQKNLKVKGEVCWNKEKQRAYKSRKRGGQGIG